MAEYNIKIKNLDKLNRAFKRSPKIAILELSKAIRTSVNIIRPVMVSEMPYSTGKMRMNVRSRSVGLRGEVGPDLSITPYAIFVHEGTKPHIIRPVHKKALYWPGAAHPVKLVHHPGTKPNRFVERTLGKVEGPVNMIFVRAMNSIIKKLI